ncbi:MAG: hypothetical protein JWP44_3640 [Mucilaginibacter sp.]|nr:hypothetical protein [Mucilaginibacter sp.]
MIDLIIFTCEGREHLLQKTVQSFTKACSYPFKKFILAVDGKIDPAIIIEINPHITIQYNTRRGYVNSIANALKLVDAPYFFWLEDDWTFHKTFDLNYQLGLLQQHKNWCQVLFSQWTPLKSELKALPINDNLYETTFGFSANPCLCNTVYIKSAFTLLEQAPKGDKLGEHGFENFLTANFKENQIKSVIIDPADQINISHEGYLESTPRSWHMTNSLEQRTKTHLLTIPKPPLWRKLLMVVKLTRALFELAIKQLGNNEMYEFSFRIIASLKSIRKRA